MNYLKGLGKKITEKLHNLKSVYRTERVLRMYKKKKYDDIFHYLKSQEKYKSVKINDYHFLYFLLSEKNSTMIEKLMNLSYKDEILNDAKNPHFLSPISFAAINNLFQEVELLQKFGGNLYIAGKDGNNLLHMACIYNRREAFMFGMQQKININAQNEDGDTPLHLAIIKENIEMINLLLQNNARIDIKNKSFFYPIHEAVETGNLEIVKILEGSLQKIRNLNSEFDPIHIAAKLENEEILRYLLRENKLLLANMEDNSDQKARPLHYACLGKSKPCAQFLLDSGANINAQDKYGNTATHIAILNNDLDMCQILQIFHPNMTLKNQDKLSPIDLVFSENNKEIFNFFRSKEEYASLFKIEN